MLLTCDGVIKESIVKDVMVNHTNELNRIGLQQFGAYTLKWWI